MLTKSQIEYLKKLDRKKYRDEFKEFLVEGKRLVLEGLKSNFKCSKLIISNDFKSREETFLDDLKQSKVEIVTISNKDFDKFASTKTPQGIAAVFSVPDSELGIISDNLIVCLENISDPGNVGTILRSCDWFGVKTVLLSENCADIFNSKVTRASMGAIFNLNIIENVNLESSLIDLRKYGFKIYIADMRGEDYRNINKIEKTVLVFSNEAFGPSEEIKCISDKIITIPQKGKIESLNVAAAAAVILSSFA